MPISSSPPDLKTLIQAALGPSSVVQDAPSVRRLYARDLADIPALLRRAFFRAVPDLVVQPANPEAVRALVAFAVESGVPLVPRGAGSSGFWGSVPSAGGIAVDLSPMDAIESIEPETRRITVQAGATWHDVDRKAGQFGLTLYTTPSSRFSTVAGWVATGGYGIDSFSHGHLSEQVEAIEVVTPEGGGVLRTLGPEDPDYDLFSGTEGQFGIITRVTLRLRPKPQRTRAFLLQFEGPEPVFSTIERIVADGHHLSSRTMKRKRQRESRSPHPMESSRKA